VAALQLAGRPAEALRVIEQWVAAEPQHAPGALLRAAVLQDARRYEDALAAFEAVLALDKDNLTALNNAAWLRQQLGKPGALALAQRAHELAANNPAVLDTLGWILLGEKREQEAVTNLSRAAELAPDAPEIRYHLAKGLVAVGKPAEARSTLETLLASGHDFEQKADARRLFDSL
jgi:tetratricopeptide (TPR) repeat protein